MAANHNTHFYSSVAIFSDPLGSLDLCVYFQTDEMEVKNPLFADDPTPKP